MPRPERFFGWRLHLICTPAGQPVAFELLPGAYHDLTPIYELTVDLPQDAALFGDKSHDWADDYDLRLYRKGIETVNSQLRAQMGKGKIRLLALAPSPLTNLRTITSKAWAWNA